MRTSGRRLALAAMGSLAGCVGAPPAAPVVTTAGDSESTTGTEPPATTASPGASETNAGVTGGTVSGGSAEVTTEAATTRGTGAAMLEISDAPQFDFGDVDVQTTASHVFTVSNVGNGPATGLRAIVVSPSFAVGEQTCGDVLEPQADCTVEIDFTATTLGLLDGTMTVGGGTAWEASVTLTGAGAGQTDNLLQNPGGELPGQPPPGWINTGSGEWSSGEVPTVLPWSGAGYIFGGQGPTLVSYQLDQASGVEAWATTIDAELLRFSFVGFARAQSNFNDEYTFRVRYLDAGGTTLRDWSLPWTTGAMWEQYSHTRYAPAGTRSVQVELGCRKTGGDFCDAFFDGLDLRASYP
ncbi:MAG: hypothetical protein K0V04_18550 [Deltaproteobacteria bacterium]|nr:hypothetical protein [Deltaproteobacteria bacterium]